MQKALKYIALLVFGFIWFLGCSRDTVVSLVDNGFIDDDYRYGDLYRLSNLSEYRVLAEKCKMPYEGQKTPVALYLAGDSFTEQGRVKANEYATDSSVRSFVAEEDRSLELVPGKKILIIETVERHLRERFSEKPLENWKLKEPLVQSNAQPFSIKKIQQSILDLEVPYREEMHESVLFSSDFILKIKEVKADLNYRFFGKTDPKVKIIKGELVYDLDVNPGISSVYDRVEDEEIDRIVKHVNATRNHYKNMGFDEVYLSIIPNKTSILVSDEKNYNHLLERVEGHKDLQTPLISVWKEFSSKNYYQKGDSHWTCAGQKIWVDKVNEKLQVNQ
jgi:hypothetical protein